MHDDIGDAAERNEAILNATEQGEAWGAYNKLLKDQYRKYGA